LYNTVLNPYQILLPHNKGPCNNKHTRTCNMYITWSYSANHCESKNKTFGFYCRTIW